MRWQEKERKREENIFVPMISDSFDCICKIPLVKHAAPWLRTMIFYLLCKCGKLESTAFMSLRSGKVHTFTLLS